MSQVPVRLLAAMMLTVSVALGKSIFTWFVLPETQVYFIHPMPC
jgi:hypothetical protein